MTETDGGPGLLARHDRELWLLTVAFFFAGDLLTTGWAWRPDRSQRRDRSVPQSSVATESTGWSR